MILKLWNFLCLGAVLSLPASAAPLQWQVKANYRQAPLEVPASRRAGFSAVPASVSGVTFTNELTDQAMLANVNLMNGSGLALGDYDGDGWCDIYFCSLDGDNILYRNLGGWKFQDVTAQAGVACPRQLATGAVFSDINGDGKLDLLVTSMGGPNSCFINQGNGKFLDQSAASGITSRLGGTTLALGDIDGNGTLDLYIANYGATSILRSGGALNISYVRGKPVVRGRYAQRIQIINNTMFELGEPDALYLNDGTGHFKAVAWDDGRFLDENGQPLKEAPWDQGLSAMFRDVNGDGAPDIYVCNDAFTPDRFWINDGTGRFRAMNPLGWRSTSHFSMGVDFADFDRDGDDDFFVVDMLSRQHGYIVTQKASMPPQPRQPGDLLTQVQIRRNTLFQNRGDGTYAEIANLAGVAGSEWSWNGIFLDVDLDGWEDLLVSNGFPYNMDDLDTKQKIRALGQLSVEQSRRTLHYFPPLDTPNMAFRNSRDLTFSDQTQEWGFGATNVSNGFALADLDNDGDLDVAVNCLNTRALLYRNDSAAPRLGVRLKGKAPNTQGIGARVVVEGGPVRQAQEVISGGRYVSGDEVMRTFAAGTGTAKLKIEVTWRNGSVSVVEGAQANHIYEIDEAGAQSRPPVKTQASTPLFSEAGDLLKHKHHETEFNDFELQPSLPNRLSQSGPGICWFDVNEDGWDDLVVGAGKGGALGLLLSDGAGHFVSVNTGLKAASDMSAILARRKAAGVTELIVGFSNLESGGKNEVQLFEVRGTNVQRTGALPVGAAVGPLALTQLRGTLALFAGGKFIPGRYPEPVASHLFLLRDGQWREEPSETLARLGSVSGAVWTDLNQDGSPELIAACDWGTLRVLEDRDGILMDRTREWGLAELTGRWQSVAAGDVNGDGRMDLVAGNWGLNSFYHQAADGQVHLYFGEFEGQGRVSIIEAYQDGGKVVPWRDMQTLGEALTWVPRQFASHRAYANASVAEILGNRSSTVVRTTTLASMVFLNQGARFEASPLPIEAQYTPVFGIGIADFDQDGALDLALAQNFFAVREEDARLDAGRGLILRGTGDGKFAAVAGTASGIMAYGEQRGLAVADFDQDGRQDFALTQNGGETKLYKNAGEKAGVRLRFKGGASNPSALGAQYRLENGPVLEVQAGAGYWSQDSFTRVIPPGAKQLLVRWPGGAERRYEIPAEAKEITLEESGRILGSSGK